MSTEVTVAIIGAAVAIITAFIGWMAKAGESSKAVIDGALKRIDQLESKTEKLEQVLDETRAELRQQRNHNFSFRRALTGALEWISDAVEWMQGERDTAPPSEPDTQEWRDLLDATR